ncbi:MAG: hypothetical protein ACOCP8_07005 [archaeon]
MDQFTAKRLNMLILSMAAKQRIFNDLESELIQLNVYEKYIDHLIEINLDLLELNIEKKDNYKRLIELYIEGEIEDPEQILETLKNDLNPV